MGERESDAEEKKRNRGELVAPAVREKTLLVERSREKMSLITENPLSPRHCTPAEKTRILRSRGDRRDGITEEKKRGRSRSGSPRQLLEKKRLRGRSASRRQEPSE